MTSPEILQRELRLRGYQQNSINTYVSGLNTIISKLGENPPLEKIKTFLIGIESRNYHKQFTAIFHHYFELVLKKPISLEDLPYPKKQYTLPDVLSQEEVRAIYDKAENIKHKTIIAILYGCGLRVSEVINLKITHIDSKRMLIKIVQAKGARDRYVPLPQELLELLRIYYAEYKPTGGYLFNGQGCVQYSARSIGQFLKEYAKKAKVKKRVYPHILRHSYATHLLERGTDIAIIQRLLGHSNQRTTLLYANISKAVIAKVTSPLSYL